MKSKKAIQRPDIKANKPPPGRKTVATSILLVDDDADLCRLNTEVLVNSGYHVDSVGDGESALQALKTIRYDLVVADNKMPKVTGVELLKKLHAYKVRVPVIMATGSLPKDAFDFAPLVPPPTVLLKPYSISDLLSVVQKVLIPSAPPANQMAFQIIPPPEQCGENPGM